MIYTPLTRKAMRIAYEAHDGYFDASGVPYLFHPIAVASTMKDEITTCVALLHDVMEDTAVTEAQLSAIFPEEIMRPLRLLTLQEDDDYFAYLERLRRDPVARCVKLADIHHNMDQSRLEGTDVPQERILHWKRKYAKALQFLEEDGPVEQSEEA